MSRENVESMRKALDAVNRHDRAAWLALCDPALLNVPPRDWPESDPNRGREAVWDFFVQAKEQWEDAVYEFGELIDAGDDKSWLRCGARCGVRRVAQVSRGSFGK
jgi:ketosteroid isomerase-like protein